MAGKRAKQRNNVFLTAFGVGDKVVEDVVVSYNEYYEESLKLIDDALYRVERGILKVKGRVYNSSGKLQSEFENLLQRKGRLCLRQGCRRGWNGDPGLG